MKRLLFIAVIWGAALLALPAQAQRGMGFRGGVAPPARGGFVGRSPGFAPRPAGFAPRPGFVPRPMPGGRIAPGAVRPMPNGRIISPSHVFVPGGHVFFPPNGIAFHGSHHFHRHHVFFNTCFNGVFDPFCQNRFLFGSSFIGPFDPFFTGFSYPLFPYAQQPEPQQPAVVEQDSRSRELALEVQELSDEIRAMREEQRSRETRKTEEAKPAPRDDGPNATLVFLDGHQLSVRNYAIADGTLWVLDEHKATKIPISKLDVPATEQINAKNGVEIHLPKNQ